MRVYESEEMYLETILNLKGKKSIVRSVDIVEELGYAKSSVSRAVNLLMKKGYIDILSNGEILLTDNGRIKAENIFERHRVLMQALIVLGANEQSAEENACRIEHVITDDIFELIKAHFDK
ncbi:MAG: metal-dependent transcriptional regulator [Clostridia bacterium]|nr:metal-dependent transcriptional regulator [Clostridia bacterium]